MTVLCSLCRRYNFHLFPRDELKTGMPSYSFSCQSSYLISIAREGFDFNACINDGELNSRKKHIFTILITVIQILHIDT